LAPEEFKTLHLLMQAGALGPNKNDRHEYAAVSRARAALRRSGLDDEAISAFLLGFSMGGSRPPSTEPEVPDDPQEARQQLAQELTKAYISSGRTLRQLAMEVGWSHTTLSRVFSGQQLPHKALLDKVAEVLGAGTNTLTKRWEPLRVAANANRTSASPGPGTDCPRCGVPISDLDKHIAFHIAIENKPAAASDSDSAGRSRPQLRAVPGEQDQTG
jgi:transcriptional regulator with XRE-family HTH domain